MEFNKQTMREIHDAINIALEDIADSYEIRITTGSLTYDPSTNTFTCSIKGEGEDARALIWNRHCVLYGLHHTDLNRTVYIKGERYQLYGINPRARKSPIIIAKFHDGSEYKISAAYAKRLLKERES